jgi:NAD-dependent DNA ligase
MLEGMGVKISSSVSKNTNYLIIKDKETLEEATGKIQKAKELGIQILTKEELLKIIK